MMAEDFEITCGKIKKENDKLLVKFRSHLVEIGLVNKTIKSHIDNLDLFSDYLTYYEPYRGLSQSESTDVHDFLDDWFIRKALWASPSAVKAYISTFKKFFKWLNMENLVPDEEYQDLLGLIKEEKEAWIEGAEINEEDCW